MSGLNSLITFDIVNFDGHLNNLLNDTVLNGILRALNLVIPFLFLFGLEIV